MHAERARAAERRSQDDAGGVREHERRAAEHEHLALAAEQRREAAELRAQAGELGERARSEEERRSALRRRREAEERDRRIRERMLRRQRRDRSGLRRWRPGPGSVAGSPGMAVVPPDDGAGMAALDREIAMVARALREHGETGRGELARLVGARYWGPGRFGAALAEAVAEGRARRVSRTTFAPAGDDAAATD